MIEATIRLEKVSRSFQRGSEEVHAVSEVSLDLYQGQLTALMGPSGSGKSTLLNLIAGWEKPDSGNIVISGTDDPFRWSATSILPQRLGLLEDLSVGENVELPLVLGGWEPLAAATRVREVLDSLDLLHLAARNPRNVSIGEQQRAAFARAMVIGSSIILADEPTGNQDSGRGDVILSQLATAAHAGATCVVATHDPEVLKHCDRIVRMHAGVLESDDQKGDPFERSPWERQP